MSSEVGAKTWIEEHGNYYHITERKIAVLIDGDNAQPDSLEPILTEVSKYGIVTVKRIYGDWTNQQMSSWEQYLHKKAITPQQQFAYTTGKNSTDSSLIIDAMDILHKGNIDGIAIVSSDSDYTRLATRFREDNKFVMGIGKKQTPEAFSNACELFVYVENLMNPTENEKENEIIETSEKQGINDKEELFSLIRIAYEMADTADSWIHLSLLNQNLQKIKSSFDPRTYGHKKLMNLIKNECNEILETKIEDTSVYVKLKN